MVGIVARYSEHNVSDSMANFKCPWSNANIAVEFIHLGICTMADLPSPLGRNQTWDTEEKKQTVHAKINKGKRFVPLVVRSWNPGPVSLWVQITFQRVWVATSWLDQVPREGNHRVFLQLVQIHWSTPQYSSTAYYVFANRPLGWFNHVNSGGFPTYGIPSCPYMFLYLPIFSPYVSHKSCGSLDFLKACPIFFGPTGLSTAPGEVLITRVVSVEVPNHGYCGCCGCWSYWTIWTICWL